MGWTYEHLSRGEKIKDRLIRDFTFENENTVHKVLDYSLVRFRTAYMAIEITDKKTGERRVIAAVILIHMVPNSQYNFGTKALDETCGPCERECPERILRLLTPTDYEYAQQWRADCWKRIENMKAKPRLKNEDVVEFKEPVQMSDGSSMSTFIVCNARGFRGFKDRYGFRYRLSKGRLSTPDNYTVTRNGKQIHPKI